MQFAVSQTHTHTRARAHTRILLYFFKITFNKKSIEGQRAYMAERGKYYAAANAALKRQRLSHAALAEQHSTKNGMVVCLLLTDAMAYIFVFERNIIQLLSHGNRVGWMRARSFASEAVAAADIAREPLRFAARLCMAAKEIAKKARCPRDRPDIVGVHLALPGKVSGLRIIESKLMDSLVERRKIGCGYDNFDLEDAFRGRIRSNLPTAVTVQSSWVARALSSILHPGCGDTVLGIHLLSKDSTLLSFVRRMPCGDIRVSLLPSTWLARATPNVL